MLPPEGHNLFCFHLADKGLRSMGTEITDTCHPIGVEYEAKHLGDEVVEFFALFLIRKF